jgi:hypothetical protein
MPNEDPSKAVEGKLELTGESAVSGERLRITYTLNNRADRPLVTYDGPAGDPKEPWPALDDAVCLSFEAPAKVHVKRICAPAPKKIQVTKLKVPTVRKLMPGQTRQVKFSLALPLRERSEYFPHHDKAPYQDHKAKELMLWIGYLPLVDGMQLVPCAPGAEVYRLQGDYLPPEQLFAKWTTPCNVTVKVRTDDQFERV